MCGFHSLTDVPVACSSTYTQDFKTLFDEADDYDLIHDVVIKVYTVKPHLFGLFTYLDT